jgi:hypothetical protein
MGPRTAGVGRIKHNIYCDNECKCTSKQIWDGPTPSDLGPRRQGKSAATEGKRRVCNVRPRQHDELVDHKGRKETIRSISELRRLVCLAVRSP